MSRESFANAEGTLAGFRSPIYARGIGVAELHLHFLWQDNQGGHEWTIGSAQVRFRLARCMISVWSYLHRQLLKTNFEEIGR